MRTWLAVRLMQLACKLDPTIPAKLIHADREIRRVLGHAPSWYREIPAAKEYAEYAVRVEEAEMCEVCGGSGVDFDARGNTRPCPCRA